MNMFDLRSVKGRGPLFIVGFAIVLAMGIWLIWVGFRLGEEAELGEEARLPITATPTSATSAQTISATATPVPIVAAPVSPLSTDTPLPPPTATMEPPTGIPPTDTPAPAVVVAGEDGVNVRSGPSANYTKLGYLQPNSEAPLIGRSGGWWQIEYSGAPAWVSGDYSTAQNAEAVPEAAAPPSPVPPPPQPTAPPAPTAVPATPVPEAANVRGLEARGYEVEAAPGPYGVGNKIWFHMWINNNTASAVPFTALGTIVAETGQFQKSWTYSEIEAGKKFEWRDNIVIPNAGTYNLWLTICFRDGECNRLMGPAEVIVQ